MDVRRSIVGQTVYEHFMAGEEINSFLLVISSEWEFLFPFILGRHGHIISFVIIQVGGKQGTEIALDKSST